MLSKQSIRKDHTIYLNGEVIEKNDMIEISKEFTDKEEIIEISKDFNEKEEKHFRKMLQQGGSLKIKGNKFRIDKYEYKQRNSKGEFEEAAKPHRNEDWE